MSLLSDSDDLRQYFATDYVGSEHFLGDDGFVFDPADLSLIGVFLRAPENTVEANGALDFWLNSDEIAGAPRLTSRRKFSVISPCDIRYLSERGDYLLCASEPALNARIGTRVMINERVSLLFQNHVYCGFLVSHPLRSLVRFDGTFEEGDIDGDFTFLLEPLHTYLNLIQEKNWLLLEQGDTAIKNGLEDILRQLAPYSEKVEPVYALRDRCQILLED